MDNVKKDLYEVYTRYFNILSNYGYIDEIQTNKVLVYTLIEELINGPYNTLITDKDYRVITDALYCLFGSSCLFEYTDKSKYIAETVRAYYPQYVADEFSELLSSENELLLVELD